LIPNRAVDEAVAEAEVVCFTRLDADGQLVDDENDDSVAQMAGSSSSSSSGAAADSGKRKAAGGGKGKAKKAKVDVCDWVGHLSDAEQHFKVCPYAGVRCPYEDCGDLVARRDLPDHQRTCDYRPQLCRWAGCGTTFVGAALAEHEENCSKREVGCPNKRCNEHRIPFDELAAHRRICRFEKVACPYAGVGCPAHMRRKDVDKHEEQERKRHNELLLARVSELQQEDESLRDEVRTLRRQNTLRQKELRSLRREELSLLREELRELQWEHHSVQVDMRALRQEHQSLQEEVRALRREAYVRHVEVRDLQQEMTALREEVARCSKQVLVVRVKHAELVGSPITRSWYSEKRDVNGLTFSMYVDANDNRFPSHYGVFLQLHNGALPCKVKCSMELMRHDGRAALTRSLEYTYEAIVGWGFPSFVSKADLANAATSPYVKNGIVTFRCTIEVVE